MEKIKTVDFNNKTYNIKYSLTEKEYLAFFTTVFNSIYELKIDDQEVPYYFSKPLILHKAVLQYYSDVNEDHIDNIINEFDDNGEKLIDIIEQYIYFKQYHELTDSIDEALDYQTKLTFYQDSTEAKINQIMDKLLEFSNNFPKWSKKIAKLLNSKDISKLVESAIPMLVKSGLFKKDENGTGISQ